MSVSEEQLSNWTNPPSDTEEDRVKNAISMVKNAINSDPKLSTMNLEVFCQGSYANNTNVRLNSDIDINVLCKDIYYFDLPPHTTKDMFPDLMKDSSAKYCFRNLKDDVAFALKNKFGSVQRKNKCLHIVENSYHSEIDVVPTCLNRQYYQDKTYSEGVALFSDSDFTKIINYPKQHISNGINKNLSTSKRYKKLVRIFKKTRYEMQNHQNAINPNISSFLLECLVWNCPNIIFTQDASWTERFKDAICHIWSKTLNLSDCKEWGEVSELLYRFHADRKWSYEDVHKFMEQMYGYVF